MTSTPAPHKAKKNKKTTVEDADDDDDDGQPKCREDLGNLELNCQVHDGRGMRTITITPKNDHLDVLFKVSQVVKRPSTVIELGYQAPWSTKKGTKRCCAYISSDEELDLFWSAYIGYMVKKTPKSGKEPPPPEILMCDMLDEQMGTKASGRGKETAAANRAAPAEDTAKVAAHAKKTKITVAINNAFFCRRHNRQCYQKFPNECGVYTHDHINEHANLVVSRVPPCFANDCSFICSSS